MPILPQINLGASPDDDKLRDLVRQLNEWARLISTEAHAADYGEGTLFLKNNQLILKKPSGEEIIIAGQQDQNAPLSQESNFLAITAASIEADSITANEISSLNFTGKTAIFDTGSIGGFDLGEDYIRDSNNTFGLSSTVTGDDDVRFWAGDSFANRNVAPFRVTEGGSINATDIKIAGQINALEPLSVTGVEPDISAAITAVSDAGGGTVNLRSGTYSPTTDILLKSGVNLIGEKESTTIIDFDSNSASIKYEDDDVYTTGTITSIASGVMVTGSGTSWLANASAGQYLFIANRHYQIAVVTSDTTLILAEGYIGNATLPGASYRISTILTDIDLAELTVKNSADDGLAIRGCKNITLKNMTFQSNNVGIDWDYVTENKFESVIVVTSTSDGVQMDNVGFGDARGLASVSNGGHGFILNTIETMPFQFCASNANTSDGINATSVIKSVFNIESRANGGQGIEFVSGSNNNIISSSLIANNTSDGIKLTATNDNNTIANSILEANGGYGVNITASSCDETILSANQFISNSSGDYNDSGTGTIIIQNPLNSVDWGDIGGTLSDQTDLQDELDDKENLSNKATDFSTINDTLYPTVEAVNEAINTAVTGLLDYRGSYDASSNLFPATGGSGLLGAILKGDFWIVSVAGTLGGTAVVIGDLVIALNDTPGQTASNWDLIEGASATDGDMTKAVYDPQTIADDAFDQDNMTDGTTNKNYTATEKTKLAGIETGADVTDEANVTDALDGATLSDVGTPASDDKILLQDSSDLDNLKYADFSEFGGGGGGTVDSVVAGNNIDVDATDPANPIVAVEALTPADIGLAASVTELDYVDGVTSAIQTQLNAKAADADVVHDTGNETVAGVKTFSSDPLIPDEAYDATNWNGVLEPPTKNAIRDKIESMSAGILPWTEVTGTSQSASVNNGYITNNAGLVTVTIPTTAPVGSVVRISGKGAGGWKVAQNASELIHFGSVDTTTGTGGSLASTNRYDAVELICVVADTEWLVLSSVGNITVT